MKIIIPIILLISINSSWAYEFVIDEPETAKDSKFQEFEIDDGYTPTSDFIVNIPYIGSVPTPDNFKKGDFYSTFTMYDNGGVNIRMLVGIFDVLTIGVSENLDGLIGQDEIRVNIPAACVKLSFYPNSRNLNLSLGFDSFAYGRNGTYLDVNGHSSALYGFHVNIGKQYNLFGFNNIFTAGIRFPLLPDGFRQITNSSLFAGATINTHYVRFGFTLENFYLDFTRSEMILPSTIVSFTPVSGFSMSLILQYEFYSRLFNRIFSLGYLAKF